VPAGLNPAAISVDLSLPLAGDYRLIGTAAALVDQQYLSRFKLRPPGAWPLVTFVIRA
jgi:hypothetical protein